MNKKTNKNGFTLVELLVALPIFVIFFALSLGTYITMQQLLPQGILQVTLQSYGRSSLKRISQDIRLAINSSVNGAGNTLTLTLDPNQTYLNSADDITIQYTISGTNITYDPDTSISNNERVLIENIQAVTGFPYFQQTQNLVVTTFKATKTLPILGTQVSTFSTSTKVRNNG